MSFDEANSLLDEIIAFLLKCGGVYQQTTTRLETVVLECIASGQYIAKRDEHGTLEHVILYWLVDKEDIESIAEGVQPINRWTGNTLYVVEHGNLAGRQSLTEVIKELRRRAGERGVTGVFWNHKGEGLKVYLKQKGV